MKNPEVAAPGDGTSWFGTRRSRFGGSLAILALVFASLFCSAQANAKNVLVLFSAFGQRVDLEPIEHSVREHFSGQVNFYSSYVYGDSEQMAEGPSYLESLAETLRRGYKDVKLDAIVVASLDALQFVTQYRDKMFPGVPIVFYGVSRDEIAGLKLLPGTTGRTESLDFADTIQLALRLHPDARAVAVIDDTEDVWWSAAHSELLRHQDRVREIDIIEPPSAEEIQRIEALPPHTLVLYLEGPESTVERTIDTYDVLANAAKHLPTYSAFHTLCLGYGCIGGVYADWNKNVAWAGETAARILSGERPEDIPAVQDSGHQAMVEWRALQRWLIPVSALPPGTVILDRPPSLWEQYRSYVIVTIVVIIVLLFLIIALLWERARKQRAETVLRESEERFRRVSNTAPVMIWMSGTDKLCTYFNKPWLEFTGRSFQDELGNGWAQGVHPEDLQKCLDIYTQSFDRRQPFRMEYRLRRHDGEYRWVLDTGVARFNSDASFAGYIGSCVDVTERKQAEVALRESEERFRVMADTTPSLIWMCDAQGNVTYLNERRVIFTGRDPKAGYGDTWTRYIHPDDRKKVFEANSRAMENHHPFSKEYRLRRKDGVYRWMLDVASPRLDGDGSFVGFIGAAIDTTDQKLAQNALQRISGQLIEAQEMERSRIARDLHDDVCQRLALLSMELEHASCSSNGPAAAFNANLEEIRKHCSEISTHVHLLSHQLHSSKLDYLGVVAAIRGLCNESSEQHQMRVVFRDKNVPKSLPKDVSLCLFRVAQEAVRNAVKYSEADEVVVEIRSVENEIQLVVQDAGAGFDVEEARKSPGLGMVSMEERMHLVHGKLSIESRPGKGTKILAVVPLSIASGHSEAANLTLVA